MTPSLPTASIALATSSPMVRSFAEMVATFVMASAPSTGVAMRRISAIAASTALSIPRLMMVGLEPAATLRMPSRTMACARTVAVVVPSPATSLVFDATSRTSCAPMFSNLSSTSISFAMVTPSLTMLGLPNFFSRTTLRPFGPRVTLTASARMFTPRSRERRADSLNCKSLAAMINLPRLQECHPGA